MYRDLTSRLNTARQTLPITIIPQLEKNLLFFFRNSWYSTYSLLIYFTIETLKKKINSKHIVRAKITTIYAVFVWPTDYFVGDFLSEGVSNIL